MHEFSYLLCCSVFLLLLIECTVLHHLWSALPLFIMNFARFAILFFIYVDIYTGYQKNIISKAFFHHWHDKGACNWVFTEVYQYKYMMTYNSKGSLCQVYIFGRQYKIIPTLPVRKPPQISLFLFTCLNAIRSLYKFNFKFGRILVILGLQNDKIYDCKDILWVPFSSLFTIICISFCFCFCIVCCFVLFVVWILNQNNVSKR